MKFNGVGLLFKSGAQTFIQSTVFFLFRLQKMLRLMIMMGILSKVIS